jgi:hypothetical protein
VLQDIVVAVDVHHHVRESALELGLRPLHLVEVGVDQVHRLHLVLMVQVRISLAVIVDIVFLLTLLFLAV